MIKYDMKEFNRVTKNGNDYSMGFLNGIQENEAYLSKQLAEIIKQLFYEYIDSTARLDPDSLHHVYEWDQVGVDSARLFRIEAFTGRQSIRFVTEFMQSTSTSPSANEPFVDKASVMESGTMVTITPRSGNALMFEGEDGDTVFTSEEVVIDNPGGESVRGSFASAVRDFFMNYLNRGMIKEVMLELEYPVEWKQGWSKGMSYQKGQKQAMQYLTIDGGIS